MYIYVFIYTRTYMYMNMYNPYIHCQVGDMLSAYVSIRQHTLTYADVC